MAETLGTLIDKLSIINLKLWHCQEILARGCEEPQKTNLINKNESLLQQRYNIIQEINEWIEKSKTEKDPSRLMSPSNKIYERSSKESS